MSEAVVDSRPKSETVGTVVQANIEMLMAERKKADRDRSVQDRIADFVTGFTGSMLFVYLHLAWFGTWIAWNVGLFLAEPFDPYPFGLLTTIVSLEAIFLSTFVLISQNRQAQISDRRNDLDLQINLLSEHEVTRLLRLCDAVAQHLGVDVDGGSEIPELKHDVQPRQVLQEMEHVEESRRASSHR